jgi:hypothetical protein
MNGKNWYLQLYGSKMSKFWCQHIIKYIVKTVCRFAALEILNDSEDINTD